MGCPLLEHCTLYAVPFLSPSHKQLGPTRKIAYVRSKSASHPLADEGRSESQRLRWAKSRLSAPLGPASLLCRGNELGCDGPQDNLVA